MCNLATHVHSLVVCTGRLYFAVTGPFPQKNRMPKTHLSDMTILLLLSFLSNVTTPRHLAKHKDLSPDSPIRGHLDILIFSFMSRHLPSLCAMDEAFVLCLLHMSFLGFRPSLYHKIWTVMGSVRSIYLWITAPHIRVFISWIGGRWLLVCPQETNVWSWNTLNSKG